MGRDLSSSPDWVASHELLAKSPMGMSLFGDLPLAQAIVRRLTACVDAGRCAFPQPGGNQACAFIESAVPRIYLPDLSCRLASRHRFLFAYHRS